MEERLDNLDSLKPALAGVVAGVVNVIPLNCGSLIRGWRSTPSLAGVAVLSQSCDNLGVSY